MLICSPALVCFHGGAASSPSISTGCVSFCVLCHDVAFLHSHWLLLLSCSWALSCIADDTRSFSRVLLLSLLITSSSWLPSSPTTWLVGVFSFGLLGFCLFKGFLPVPLLVFLVEF